MNQTESQGGTGFLFEEPNTTASQGGRLVLDMEGVEVWAPLHSSFVRRDVVFQNSPNAILVRFSLSRESS